MKRFCGLLIVALSLVTMVLAGCSGSAPTPTTTAAPPPGQPKVIELKYAHYQAENSVTAQITGWWADQVAKRTQGRVKVTVYYSGTLGTVTEIPDNVLKGVADAGNTSPPIVAGRFPVQDILTQIPFEIKSFPVAGHLMNDLYYQHYMDKELEGLKPLGFFPIGDNVLFSNKRIKSMEDLKGQRIRVNAPMTSVFQALGADPVGLPTQEIYSALEKRVVDAMEGGAALVTVLKLYEVQKYVMTIPFWQGVNVSIMNRNKWDSLPPDIQLILEQLNHESEVIYLDRIRQYLRDSYTAAASKGMELYAVTPEELGRWKAKTAFILDDYAKSLSAKGLPGEEVKKRVRSVLEQYSN